MEVGASRWTPGRAHIENCRFEDNEGRLWGGAASLVQGDFTIADCEFHGNRGGNDGGGAVLLYESTALFDGSHFEANATTSVDELLPLDFAGQPRLAADGIDAGAFEMQP